ncbi:hypothetical protein N9V90_03245, partial [Endozoicomonas sp.]|nr:hypothetical protein [Endozoicomonas sp.]
MAIKILAMTIFLYLVHTVSIYQKQHFFKLNQVYILLALILTSFILLDHMGEGIPVEGVHGIFGNKNEAGWFIAAACIVVGYKLIVEKFNPYLFGIFLILLSLLWIIGSRASLLAFFSGMLMVLIKHQKYRTKLLTLAVFIGLISISVIYLSGSINDINALISRADNGRFEIYLNAFTQISLNIKTIAFGHGLAASARNVLSSGITINNWHSIY